MAHRRSTRSRARARSCGSATSAVRLDPGSTLLLGILALNVARGGRLTAAHAAPRIARTVVRLPGWDRYIGGLRTANAHWATTAAALRFAVLRLRLLLRAHAGVGPEGTEHGSRRAARLCGRGSCGGCRWRFHRRGWHVLRRRSCHGRSRRRCGRGRGRLLWESDRMRLGGLRLVDQHAGRALSFHGHDVLVLAVRRVVIRAHMRPVIQAERPYPPGESDVLV